MTSSISLLRDALSRSLESAASSTPTKHKKHVTYCGYCYFANGSWQIRFKPFGVSVSVGVLGGNQAVPTTHNPSQWLGRLDREASTSDVENDRVPPADLVMIVLKRAELRNVLQLTRKQVDHGRKQFPKLLVVKLRDETEFDMAPVLREILGEDPLCKHRTLAMLDYSLAYIKSTSFPGLQMDVNGWKLTLSGKPMIATEYEDVEPVKKFVTACLNPGPEKSNQDHAEKLKNDCRQVAGAATCESSVETPRSAMDITTPFGVAMKGLQVRFLMDEQPMLRTPPSRRQLISMSHGNGVSMIVEEIDEQVTDRGIASVSDRLIVRATRSVTDTLAGSRDSDAETSLLSRNSGGFEELYKTCKPGIVSQGLEEEVIHLSVDQVEFLSGMRKEQCQSAGLEATAATTVCDREEPEEKVQPSGYAVPPESTDSTAIPTNVGEVAICAVEVDSKIRRKFTENGTKTPDVEPYSSAVSRIIGNEVTQEVSDRVRVSTLEDGAIIDREAMISTRSANENGRVRDNDEIETELKPEYISGFLKRLSNEGNESGFIAGGDGDIGMYVENALISPQLLTDYSLDSGAIEPEFNDCLGEGQVATASDAAEILALTSNGSFDIQDDDGRHDHGLVGDGHVHQMELCELRKPIEVVRAPSFDETPAEIIGEATSAFCSVENECHDTIHDVPIHQSLKPTPLVPIDDEQTTFEVENRIQENVMTAVLVHQVPDNDLRSPCGTTPPQENNRDVTCNDYGVLGASLPEIVFSTPATDDIPTDNYPEAETVISHAAHEKQAVYASTSRPMTRSRKVLDEGEVSAGAKSKKRKLDEVVVADRISTRRSARFEKTKHSEEPAKSEASQGDVEVQQAKLSRSVKVPKHCEDSIVPPSTGKKRALFSDGKLKTNPTRRALVVRRSIPRGRVLPQGPQWAKLDHKMIISDYVYGGNSSLPFGESVQSALSAVELELDKLAPTLETPESIEEEQAYNRSIRSRARLMYSEKAVREKEKLQFEEQLRLFQIQQRNMKKSPEQLEYEEFQIRQICFDGGDEFECKCGVERCQLCSSETDLIPSSVVIIDAPAFRPSSVTDSWRENTIEDEPELTGFGVKVIGAHSSIKRRRTSRRSQRSSSKKCGLMLLEMKHTLTFLDKYNRGY